jgi:hypothetical protein
MKKSILILLAGFPLAISAQQNNVSVQQQIEALSARVAALELRVAEQEAIIRKLQLKEPPRATITPAYSQTEAPRSSKTSKVVGGVKTTGLSIMDQLRSGLSYTKLPADGPWTRPENWQSLKKGMTVQDVQRLLGSPLFTKDSIRPRADYYWQYAGKLPNGEQMEGRVRFYKDKLTTWDLPKF